VTSTAHLLGFTVSPDLLLQLLVLLLGGLQLVRKIGLLFLEFEVFDVNILEQRILQFILLTKVLEFGDNVMLELRPLLQLVFQLFDLPQSTLVVLAGHSQAILEAFDLHLDMELVLLEVGGFLLKPGDVLLFLS